MFIILLIKYFLKYFYSKISNLINNNYFVASIIHPILQIRINKLKIMMLRNRKWLKMSKIK